MEEKQQKPFTTSQIKEDRPSIPKSIGNDLGGGFIAGSMNGGINKVVFSKEIMAGERHTNFGLQLKVRLLTPKTPAYQNLRMTARAFFVPYSRVWTNAEKFQAQRGGATEDKITELPNFGGFQIPLVYSGETGSTDRQETLLSNTTIWRDSFISAFLPRMGLFETRQENAFDSFRTLPKVNALKVRAIPAIYNDFLRNKEFDPEMPEYKSDTVSQEEFEYYMPKFDGAYPVNGDFYQLRAKRDNSYYTDFRTELQGFEVDYPPEDMSSDASLINWMSKFEQLYDLAVSEANDAQKNYWDIIAEIRGSKVLTEGKVLKLAQKTFNLNYASITQSTYNTATDIPDEYRVMGQQGGYSYTEINLPLYDRMAFIEEGVLIVMLTSSAETVFESGIYRGWMNVEALNRYRPELVDQKHDVLYAIECGTKFRDEETDPYKVKGFKRKFNEIFYMENNCQGDLTTTGYFEQANEDEEMRAYYNPETVVQPNKSYQFFEESENEYYDEANKRYIAKAPWKDYTDLQINENLAVQLPILWNSEVEPSETFIQVKGQNQIDYVGRVFCKADLPVDDKIKSNYRDWGEH